MKNGQKALSFEQTARLMGLIKRAWHHNKSISQISRDHPEYTHGQVAWTCRKMRDPKQMEWVKRTNKIRLLLLDARRRNITLTDLSRENPDISFHTLRHWNINFNILPIVEKYKFSDKKLKEILVHSEIHGVAKTIAAYGLKNAMLIYEADKKFAIRSKPEHVIAKRNRTDADRYEIAEYAIEHGVCAAARHYKVNESTVTAYKKKFFDFVPDGRDFVAESEKAIAAARVKEINSCADDFPGVAIVSEETGISASLIYKYNLEHDRKLFDTHHKAPNKLSEMAERALIDCAATAANTSELIRETGHSRRTVRRVLADKNVDFKPQTIGLAAASAIISMYASVNVAAKALKTNTPQLRKQLESYGFAVDDNGAFLPPRSAGGR